MTTKIIHYIAYWYKDFTVRQILLMQTSRATKMKHLQLSLFYGMQMIEFLLMSAEVPPWLWGVFVKEHCLSILSATTLKTFNVQEAVYKKRTIRGIDRQCKCLTAQNNQIKCTND